MAVCAYRQPLQQFHVDFFVQAHKLAQPELGILLGLRQACVLQRGRQAALCCCPVCCAHLAEVDAQAAQEGGVILEPVRRHLQAKWRRRYRKSGRTHGQAA